MKLIQMRKKLNERSDACAYTTQRHYYETMNTYHEIYDIEEFMLPYKQRRMTTKHNEQTER